MQLKLWIRLLSINTNPIKLDAESMKYIFAAFNSMRKQSQINRKIVIVIRELQIRIWASLFSIFLKGSLHMYGRKNGRISEQFSIWNIISFIWHWMKCHSSVFHSYFSTIFLSPIVIFLCLLSYKHIVWMFASFQPLYDCDVIAHWAVFNSRENINNGEKSFEKIYFCSSNATNIMCQNG